MGKKLTIAILTLPDRWESFIKLLQHLNKQKEDYNLQDEVEIIYLGDNESLTVGQKRNACINMATGENIAFIDDDDWVHRLYLIKLITAIQRIPTVDIYTFSVEITQMGKDPKPVFYSLEFLKDQNFKDRYYRIPNHLCAVKTRIAKQVLFKEINFQEDSDYAKRLLPYLKTEVVIFNTLYYYRSNWETSKTLPDELRKRLLNTL